MSVNDKLSRVSSIIFEVSHEDIIPSLILDKGRDYTPKSQKEDSRTRRGQKKTLKLTTTCSYDKGLSFHGTQRPQGSLKIKV